MLIRTTFSLLFLYLPELACITFGLFLTVMDDLTKSMTNSHAGRKSFQLQTAPMQQGQAFLWVSGAGPSYAGTVADLEAALKRRREGGKSGHGLTPIAYPYLSLIAVV